MDCLMRTSQNFHALNRDRECRVKRDWQHDLSPNSNRKRDVQHRRVGIGMDDAFKTLDLPIFRVINSKTKDVRSLVYQLPEMVGSIAVIPVVGGIP